ncbi:GTPase-activating protein [Martiniozyma asiatica (nom. inval.)]|nr:GTPase-activating protein [Martiniozyma asiatica]
MGDSPLLRHTLGLYDAILHSVCSGKDKSKGKFFNSIIQTLQNGHGGSSEPIDNFKNNFNFNLNVNVKHGAQGITVGQVSAAKKQFEEESKKFYDFLAKFLLTGHGFEEGGYSSEKLVKIFKRRKNWELSKLGYFNWLYDIVMLIYLTQLKIESNPAYQNLKEQIAVNKQYRLEAVIAIEKCQSLPELEELLRPLLYVEIYHSQLTLVSPKEKCLNFVTGIGFISNEATGELKKRDAPTRAGLLFTQHGQKKQGWHKQWVVLRHGKLYEFMDWRNCSLLRNEPINVGLCNIKSLNDTPKATTNRGDNGPDALGVRRNCFRIMSNLGKEHVFQAFSDSSVADWLESFESSARMGICKRKGGSVSSSSSSLVLRDKSNSMSTSQVSSHNNTTGSIYHNNGINNINNHHHHHHHNNNNNNNNNNSNSINNHNNNLNITHNHIPKDTLNSNKTKNTSSSNNNNNNSSSNNRPRRVSSISSTLLEKVKSTDSSNLKCVDCGTENPDWISTNLLVTFCIKCSASHRGLGTSISKVKSLTLDSFTNNLRVLIEHGINNFQANSIWEATIDASEKINATCDAATRSQFIKNKYMLRKWIGDTTSNANESLLKGISLNDFAMIMYSIAHGADLKNTKLIEVALLHPVIQSGQNRFLSAELLAQNGLALGDAVPPNTIISGEAKKWWQEKINRLKGPVESLQPIASIRVDVGGSVLRAERDRGRLSPKEGFSKFKRKMLG